MKKLFNLKNTAIKAAAGICMTAGTGCLLATTVLGATPAGSPDIIIHTSNLDQVVKLEWNNQNARDFLRGYKITDADLDDVIENLTYQMMIKGYLDQERGRGVVCLRRKASADPQAERK